MLCIAILADLSNASLETPQNIFLLSVCCHQLPFCILSSRSCIGGLPGTVACHWISYICIETGNLPLEFNLLESIGLACIVVIALISEIYTSRRLMGDLSLFLSIIASPARDKSLSKCPYDCLDELLPETGVFGISIVYCFLFGKNTRCVRYSSGWNVLWTKFSSSEGACRSRVFDF